MRFELLTQGVHLQCQVDLEVRLWIWRVGGIYLPGNH